MQIHSPFDRAYFETRLDRNLMLAARSDNPAIRELHMHYVRLYEALLDQLQPADQAFA